MIYIGVKGEYEHKKKLIKYHYLVSNKDVIELMKFGEKIGINKKTVINNRGERLHFEIFSSFAPLAIKQGAKEISKAEILNMIKINNDLKNF